MTKTRTILSRNSSKARSAERLRRVLMASASSALMVLASAAGTKLRAAPLGGTVASGSATIVATNATTTTTINQSSDRAAIDWTSFNLTATETANFVVPASTSATLNRITGGGVSTISGTVSSNGVVFFVNPNGMVFDASSRVSANGFVASTANISNFDFMRGSNFGGAFTTASTVNSAAMNLAGEITTLTKGAVAIIGPTVTNTGTITANQGMVILAAVDAATVDYRPRFSRNDGLALLTIAPNSGLAHGFAVSNSGTITSNGGQIALQAAAVLPSLPPEVSRPMAP